VTAYRRQLPSTRPCQPRAHACCGRRRARRLHPRRALFAMPSRPDRDGWSALAALYVNATTRTATSRSCRRLNSRQPTRRCLGDSACRRCWRRATAYGRFRAGATPRGWIAADAKWPGAW
jgi:hypothetical protein